MTAAVDLLTMIKTRGHAESFKFLHTYTHNFYFRQRSPYTTH